jgi:hypothetical protein
MIQRSVFSKMSEENRAKIEAYKHADIILPELRNKVRPHELTLLTALTVWYIMMPGQSFNLITFNDFFSNE